MGCIIVTDVSNIESVHSALKWKDLVEENCDYFDGKPIPMIMVQNKIDLLEEKLEEDMNLERTKGNIAKQFAKENNFITNVQVSAKENINLEKIFKKLINEIQRRKLIIDDSASNFGEGDGKNSRSKSSFLELQKNFKKKNSKECKC